MLTVHTNWYHIRFARMIEETAYVTIEIGIDAKLQEQQSGKKR